jgi:lysophospholipase L1-like esterase
MQIRRFSAITALQVALTILVLEVVARVVDPLGISYYPETARFLDRLQLGGPLGYQLPPHMDERFWGVRVRTNSLGLRDHEVPREKPPGEFRVVMLGDSAVFSLGVENEDSIPAQLERLLNRRAPANTRYRSLNLGVPSYNTEQELIQLERLGLDLDPDAIVLYFATNDIEPKMWVYEKRRNRVINCAQRSFSASIAYVLFQRIRAYLRGAEQRIQYASYAAGNPRWQAIESSLRRMAGLLSERNIPFLVVSAGPADAPHMLLLRELASSAGFRIEQLDGSIDPEWAADPERFVNSATDRHCNPRGCHIMAVHIARFLRDSGALGRP